MPAQNAVGAYVEERMQSGREIELKLSVRPDRLERVMRSPDLKPEGARRAIARALKNIYYDTPHLALRERGLVLRIREARRRFVQTLKSGGNGSGLMRRLEWEKPVTGPKPDLARIDDAGLRERIGDAAGRLAPVFTSEIRRITRTVQRGNAARVEVAIDQGRVLTSRGSAPICEIELELKDGNTDALYDLALALNKVTPLRLETTSKSDRGYAMLTEDAIAWSKAVPLALDPGGTGADAFEAILRHNLSHLMRNERAAQEGRDPEGVHQVRVALRRLRSVLILFRRTLPQETEERLGAELKWLAGEMGPARDLDVFLGELLRPLQAALPEDAGLMLLEARARDERGAAYERVRAAFATGRYTALLLEIGRLAESRLWHDSLDEEAQRLLAKPALSLAGELMNERYHSARKRGRGFAKLTATEQHRLRLGVKKLRYAADCFRSLYDAEVVLPYMKRLSRLQDALGHLSDVETAERLLASLGGNGSAAEAAALGRASGLVIGWHGRGAKALEPKLRKHWKAFKAATPFWGEDAG